MQIIGERYVLMGEPNTGGMSLLYKAFDTQREGRHVALKIYYAKPIEDEILKESFRRERMALKELRHDNIVSISDEGFIEEQQRYYTVLEWLPQSYAAHLKSSGSIDWATFYTNIGRPILEAISFAHNRSYIHRDLKTENIMLSAEGKPKIIDFGTSKLKRYISYGLTLREFSSEPFSPPELDDGSNAYARDTYSYCVTALDALTGGILTTRDDVLNALQNVKLSGEVREILQRGLAQDPEDRIQNAEALLADLDAAERTRIKVVPIKADCYIQLTSRA
ncbi:serine/threonine-protein kinase, partial [Streptomyces sp. NPDC050698]